MYTADSASFDQPVPALLFAQDTTINITSSQAINAAIYKVDPVYPEMAKMMKLTGTVLIKAVNNYDGTVESVSVVSGNPLLTGSACDALKQWKFTPFTQNGSPVKAVCVLAFDFKT